MRPRSELHGLKVRDLRTLLKSLHKIAERKLVLEALAEYSRSQVPQRRREREAFSTLRDHLDKACGHIQIACQKLREQLLEVEARLPPDVRLSESKSQIPWERYFSRKRMPPTKTESEPIADYLMAARNFAQECADLRAAAIHPSLRTRSEKKLAKRWLSVSGTSEPEGYPLIGVSTPAIDLWFIGQAHSRLQKFESQFSPGWTLTNKLRILSQLFDVLFKEQRSPDNIRKELERQKKNGVPEYDWPVWIDLEGEFGIIAQRGKEYCSVILASFSGGPFSAIFSRLRDKHWTQLLGWTGYQVYRHEIDDPGKKLKLWVRRKRANKFLVCSGCGRLVSKIAASYECEVRDLPFFGYRTTVVIELYRVRCRDCGVKAAKVPLLSSKASFRERFEDAVGQAC
jgi:hypothetical protein